MDGWVWSNGGMILTGENWSAGRKTLYSVCGIYMNEYAEIVEWYWQGKAVVHVEKGIHKSARCVIWPRELLIWYVSVWKIRICKFGTGSRMEPQLKISQSACDKRFPGAAGAVYGKVDSVYSQSDILTTSRSLTYVLWRQIMFHVFIWVIM